MTAITQAALRAQVKRLEKSLDHAKTKIGVLGKAVAEGRQRERATAAVLRVISRSPTDPQPVFDAIARAAMRLLGGVAATVTRVDGDVMHLAAWCSTNETGAEVLKRIFPRSLSVATGAHDHAYRTRAVHCISDTEKCPPKSQTRMVGRARGHRSLLIVPMLRRNASIGTIAVSRRDPGSFSAHDVELLKTFADQAVVAIENARLFKELQARNIELSEALEQQTATAEILKVISLSPTGPQPVFDAIVHSASQLLGGAHAYIRLVEGGRLVTVASSRGPVIDPNSVPLGEAAPGPRAIRERRVVHVADVLAEDWIGEWDKERARRTGRRADLHAPMLTDNGAIGTIAGRRNTPGYFSDKHVALLQTFAAQAVIAIENVRKTHETREALEQLSATSEVLKVMTRSPMDVQPVFDAIVNKGLTLFGGATMGLRLVKDGHSQVVACTIPIDPADNAPVPITEVRNAGTRAICTASVVQVPDVLKDGLMPPEYNRRRGVRAMVCVPLLRDGRPIGALSLSRATLGLFPAKQIELLQTFADQAVIAIETVHQFHELKAKSRQLEAANEHKSRFLAAASHDLRQPMHALQMFVESLQLEIGHLRRAQPLIGRLQDSIAVMSGMLDALLDISDLETGGTKPVMSDFPVARLLRRIENTFSPIAGERGLRLRVVASDAWMHSDAELIARIVENFVSNAIKYTSSGGVVVGCRRRANCLSIEVWDSGLGIPSAHQKSIFQEFFQVDNPARDRRKGLGLGLAIAERIARLLDHRIRFRSVHGRGSMFAVEVPFGDATQQVAAPMAMIHGAISRLNGMRVAVVDDEIDILEATTQLLKRWGCEVLAARSEAEILEALRSASATPDFLICDYQLPNGENGLSVIRNARRAYGTAIPAVVISGNASPELRTATREAGITLLLKPVAPPRLRQVMQRLLSG